jgi:hypothetical protein
MSYRQAFPREGSLSADVRRVHRRFGRRSRYDRRLSGKLSRWDDDSPRERANLAHICLIVSRPPRSSAGIRWAIRYRPPASTPFRPLHLDDNLIRIEFDMPRHRGKAPPAAPKSGCPRKLRSCASRICNRSRATGAEAVRPVKNRSRRALMRPSVPAIGPSGLCARSAPAF